MPNIDIDWWLDTIPPESDSPAALGLMIECVRREITELDQIRRKILDRYGRSSTVLRDWDRCVAPEHSRHSSTFSRLLARAARFEP